MFLEKLAKHAIFSGWSTFLKITNKDVVKQCGQVKQMMLGNKTYPIWS